MHGDLSGTAACAATIIYLIAGTGYGVLDGAKRKQIPRSGTTVLTDLLWWLNHAG